MKRITLLSMLLALLSVTAFAQKGKNLRQLQGAIQSPSTMMTKAKGISRRLQPAANVPSLVGDQLVTPPETATVETWYTVEGEFYASSDTWVDITSEMKTINLAFDGDDIYIQGIGYWFKDSWIKGKINGGTVVFPSYQYIGEDEYGPEYIIGSDDGETLSDDIIFNYNAEQGILSAVTPVILENGKKDTMYPYCYWLRPTFSKDAPAAPEQVVVPEDLVSEEYVISYIDNNDEPATAYLNIGFDGNDVYIQGLCSYVPEAWVKGTLDGTTITIPGGQYFGPYSKYEMFLQDEDVVLTYDAEANKLTSSETITIVTADGLKGDIYNEAVIIKVVEKAGTPATPSISEILDSQDGPVAMFSVPAVDVDGNGMVSSKLSFQFFYDVEQEINPVTFEPEYYKNLTEAMTVIPYGFADDWDFYPTYIYMNQPDFKNWNKIGIQSIYTGGGEENKSEIFWLTLKEYGKTGFDFNAMVDEPCSSSDSNDGDIEADRVLTSGDVTLTISPKAEDAPTPNRFWKAKEGTQLRVYSGTLTFETTLDKVITKIVFNAGKWNEGNSADTGAFDGTTWTGEANKVVVTIAGNTQINSIEVQTSEFVPTAVEAPEDLTTETYVFKSIATEAQYDPADEVALPYSTQVEVGFDGDDVYIQGLSADAPELWVKGTKNEEGKYVIPANQFMGSLELWGGLFSFDYYFTAIDEAGNMVDAVLDFDAEKSRFTTSQTLVLNGELAELYPYITFTDVTIEKFIEVAATPADPILEAINFEDKYPSIYCSIPAVGTNGEALNLNKLFYTVWIEKDGEQQPYTFTADAYSLDFEEDVMEVPYNHDGEDLYAYGEIIYFEETTEELSTWTKVGIQSIYYGEGECNKSNVVWLENGSGENPGGEEDPAVGISDIHASKGGKTSIFNIVGQRLSAPQKGMNIINGRKVVVK
ncbi:MAG: hypothetical protein IJ910_05790 [Bacteroidaceae bacterium]|nr:hypothetical protein [Bacteroidaceae bacterium]